MENARVVVEGEVLPTRRMPGPGRPKGCPNKTTAALKAAIMSVYEALQDETSLVQPHAHLLEWARANPTDFYTKVAPRLLPLEMKADMRGEVDIRGWVLERAAAGR